MVALRNRDSKLGENVCMCIHGCVVEHIGIFLSVSVESRHIVQMRPLLSLSDRRLESTLILSISLHSSKRSSIGEWQGSWSTHYLNSRTLKEQNYIFKLIRTSRDVDDI